MLTDVYCGHVRQQSTAIPVPDYPDRLIHELFEDHVRRTPHAIAVLHNEHFMTYASLNAKANRLARLLVNQGVGPDEIVALFAVRSVEAVVSQLAILKAGGAYLPLDPDCSRARLEHMLKNAAPRVLLAHGELGAIPPDTSATVITVDRKLREIYGYVSEDLSSDELALTPKNLAYVVYISGETDCPKAIAMPHCSMANLIECQRRAFHDRGPSRALQLAFPDTFSTLCTGGTLVLVDEWIRRNPRALAEVANKDSIQRLVVPPGELHALAEFCSHAGVSVPTLQNVVTGGERLRVSPEIVAFFSQPPGCRLHNFRYTTDTFVLTTLSLDGDPQSWPDLLMTERPIDDVQLYRFDKIRQSARSPADGARVDPEHIPHTEQPVPSSPESERLRVIELFNSTETHYPRDKLIHQLFEEQVERSAEAEALAFAGHSLSYTQLNTKANQLARYLRRRGVGPHARVGIFLERSLELVIGLIGTLKAGAAYLPLDHNQPAERLGQVLEDAKPAVVLTQSAQKSRLPAIRIPVISVDAQWEEMADEDTHNLDHSGMTSESLAYVMYTSGSTGQPKGVMVRHRNVVNYATHAVCQFGVAAGEGSLIATSMNFDLALTGFYPPLICGRAVRLCAHDEDLSQALLAGRGYSPVKLTPTHLSILSLSGEDIEGRIRTLVIGGELLQGSALRWWRQHSPSTRIFNHYGPTEATIGCVVHEVQEDINGPVPIGRPISNVQIYILDAYLSPVPIGVVGEIYIGGEGVAVGYWNRPALTAERFLPDPFGSDPRARMYRSGDLGRWRADGAIEYLGRNDDQVKIRGFRIELGEIGAQLVGYEKVKEAVVIAREDTPGDKRLVAYVTSRGADRPSAEALRAHVKAVLPDYMVPSAFVVLDRLPLTQNSKLDKRALPVPEDDAYARSEYEPPANELEGALAGIWQKLLKVERVGRDDNFFELGGHSLLIVKMLEQLRRIGLLGNPRSVYETTSLKGFAQTLVTSVATHSQVPLNRIPPDCESITPGMLPLIDLESKDIAQIMHVAPGGSRNIQDIYPLTPLQEGILFHHLFHESGGDTYVLLTLLSVPSRQRLTDFINALQTVIDRHDILRTAVLWQNLSRPVQIVYRDVKLPVEEIKLDGERNVREQLEAWMAPERQKLDLTRAPLLHLQVAADPRGAEWYAILQVHHIVSDYESKAKMLLEVMACLQGEAQKLPVPIPFRDHVARVVTEVRSHDSEAFFRSKLGDVNEPTAPFGLLDIRGDASRVDEAQETLDSGLAGRIRTQARRLGVSDATLFHAAWALVVSNTSGRGDVLFGTVLLGRMQSSSDAQGALGMFVNTLPLRIDLRGLTARELVEKTLRELVDLLNYEQASLSVAQRCSGVGGSAPLFSALLNYVHGSSRADSEQRDAGSGVEILARRKWTNYPIVVSVEEEPETFVLNAQTERRIDPSRITAYLRTALQSLVNALELAPQTHASKLPVLPESERRYLIDEINATRRPYPHEKTLNELFEECVRQEPNKSALIHETQRFSYAELNNKANRLACYLSEKGVNPGESVAVVMERCPAQVIAQLAILKCGGMYVPIDPKLPSERQAFMITDCGACRAIVDKDSVAHNTPELVQWISYAAADQAAEGMSVDDFEPVDAASLPAYVMYTSGSTGTPKGVVVPQHAIANLVINNSYAAIGPDDCVAYCSNPTFDASTLEVWSGFLNGARVVIVPQEVVLEAKRLAEVIGEHGVTILFLTIGLFTQHADVLAPVLPRLRYLMTGGDVFDPALARRVLRNTPPQHLLNCYGPTECTTYSTTFVVESLDDELAALPIGRPIANVNIYILNAELDPVPIGAVGEIHIGGAGVALGYLNRPELTATRFVPDPFNQNPGARLYKSGDLGRWRTDGCIEFLGRSDGQVKVRGYRIELGEIESRLLHHAQVNDAVVVAREDVPGQKRLVAYITPGEGVAPAAESLREYLSAELPDYMVPAAFVILSKLPLTSNGKVDRRALPAPALDAFVSRQYEPPLGEIEEIIARIWTELLRVDRVGRCDHFFELGGHSLLAMQVMVRIRTSLSIEISISELFDRPLLREFSAQVEERREQQLFERLADDDAELDELLTRVASMPEHEVDKVISVLRGEKRP